MITKHKTRRTPKQARHDAAARRVGKTGWIIQHSHPCHHVLRGLMSISRSAQSLGAKTQATSRLLHVDLVTARMMIQDAPVVRKHRGPRFAEDAAQREAARVNGYSGADAQLPSRRDRRTAHAKAAKARAAMVAR